MNAQAVFGEPIQQASATLISGPGPEKTQRHNDAKVLWSFRDPCVMSYCDLSDASNSGKSPSAPR